MRKLETLYDVLKAIDYCDNCKIDFYTGKTTHTEECRDRKKLRGKVKRLIKVFETDLDGEKKSC